MHAFLLGPYATKSQKLLAYSTGIFFAVAIIGYSFYFQLSWSWWQIIIAAIVSFDIPAGSVANNFPEVKQYWEELRLKGSGVAKFFANKMVFASLHLFYIGIMGWSFWENTLGFVLVMGLLLLGATYFVSRAENHMARSAAISMVALSMVVNIFFQPPSALWWFMPLLIVKVVSGFTTPSKVQ